MENYEIKQTVQTIYDEHKKKLDNMKDNLRSIEDPTDYEFNLLHEQITVLAAVLGDLYKKVLSPEDFIEESFTSKERRKRLAVLYKP